MIDIVINRKLYIICVSYSLSISNSEGIYYPLFKGFLVLLPHFADFLTTKRYFYEQFIIIEKSTKETKSPLMAASVLRYVLLLADGIYLFYGTCS